METPLRHDGHAPTTTPGRSHSESDHARGQDRHEGHTPEMFRNRLVLSLALTIPILYLSEQLQEWFGYSAVTFTGDHLVNPILGSVLFGYAGSVFLRGAAREIRDRTPGMMTLVALATGVAYTYSLAVSLGVDGMPFYWELATLLDVMLLGHWIEMRSVQSASRALDHLATMIPTVAHRVGADGSTSDVAVADLTVGDRVLIRPGEQVPTDGEVITGASSLNEAFLTGESLPVLKQAGDEVVAGSVNGEGALTIQVIRIGDATTLSQIMRLVADAQASRSRYQVLADRAAAWLTLIAVGAALPTVILWATVGDRGIGFAVARAVTVLVIACPHALGLAIPLVTANATAMAATNGILVRNRDAFERGRAIETVAFDKTGTLTEGRLAVSEITTTGIARADALALAAAVERSSEHPLARAIVATAEREGGTIPPSSGMQAVAGQGVTGTVAGKAVRVGRPEWFEQSGIDLHPKLTESLRHAAQRGESAVVVAADDLPVAVFAVADRVRDSARKTIRRLHDLGVATVMITGDSAAVAEGVAADLAIDTVHSRVLPADKAHLVAGLSAARPTVFVGDGINDAPALLAADLGVAIGAGTNVAIESADIVLVDDDPEDVVRALSLARLTSRKMRQNLGWATGYNVVALPLAAGVAARWGVLLDPAVGALLMSMSTVVVAVNAMTLRRADLG